MSSFDIIVSRETTSLRSDNEPNATPSAILPNTSTSLTLVNLSNSNNDNAYRERIWMWTRGRGKMAQPTTFFDHTIVSAALTNEQFRDIFLSFRGSDAELMMTALQKLLDGDRHRISDWRYPRLRLLLALSLRSGKLPPALYVTGVVFKSDRPVGMGAFADVYQGSRGTQVVALKRLRSFATTSVAESERGKKRFLREALVWIQLAHDYILPFLGICYDGFGEPCMVSPWMSQGNILDCIINHPTMRAARDRVLHQIAEGIAYLHSQNVIHGDIRGANVLMDEDFRPRLADFGLAILEDSHTIGGMTSHGQGGSCRWMAPELHDPERFGYEHYPRSFKSDVYSFASLCFELHTLTRPFVEIVNDTTVVLRVLEGKRPCRPVYLDQAISDALWELMEQCWHEEADKRPPIDAVCMSMSMSVILAARADAKARANDVPDGVDPTSHAATDLYMGSKASATSIPRSSHDSGLNSPMSIDVSPPGVSRYSPMSIDGAIYQAQEPHHAAMSVDPLSRKGSTNSSFRMREFLQERLERQPIKSTNALYADDACPLSVSAPMERGSHFPASFKISNNP